MKSFVKTPRNLSNSELIEYYKTTKQPKVNILIDGSVQSDGLKLSNSELIEYYKTTKQPEVNILIDGR